MLVKTPKEKRNVVGEVLLWFWWIVTLRMREGFLEEVALRQCRRKSTSFRMRWQRLVNEL